MAEGRQTGATEEMKVFKLMLVLYQRPELENARLEARVMMARS